MNKATQIVITGLLCAAAGAGAAVVAVKMTAAPSVQTSQAARNGGLDPLQPIVHAQAAGVLTCAEGIVRAARGAIEPGVRHNAVSTWVSESPNQNIFASIAALDYGTQGAPRAVAVLTGTPTPKGGCDTASVQIHPTTRACAAIDADLGTAGGRTRSNLNGVTLVKTADGAQRHLLIPEPSGKGCTIVAVAIANVK